MANMIEKDCDAYKLIENCKASFVLMVNQLQSYDFYVVKM